MLCNYKLYYGKYIIFEDNGKAKEYEACNNILIFDGEYKNGKWNGIGKEFNKEELIFEGEYLNGKKNGKGKSYYSYGGLKFEGEYLNGKRWNGKGKEYDRYGKLEFEGEYLNGERNGKGKEYYYNGTLRFEGEYLYNAKRKGKFYINKLSVLLYSFPTPFDSYIIYFPVKYL